jgi:hypothetical protein
MNNKGVSFFWLTLYMDNCKLSRKVQPFN